MRKGMKGYITQMLDKNKERMVKLLSKYISPRKQHTHSQHDICIASKYYILLCLSIYITSWLSEAMPE